MQCFRLLIIRLFEINIEKQEYTCVTALPVCASFIRLVGCTH